MKNVSKYLLLSGFALILLAPVNAQGQSIAVINSDQILMRMPEYQGIDQRLRQLAEAWREDLREMDQEIETLQSDFEAREILFTPEMRQERRQEIDNKIRDRERYLESRFGPNGDYFQQQDLLLEPIQQQVVEAVIRVAEREGYDFVLDVAENPSVFYFRNQFNINEDVLLELGIQPEE